MPANYRADSSDGFPKACFGTYETGKLAGRCADDDGEYAAADVAREGDIGAPSTEQAA
jgi:hypothetical protein